VLPCDILDGQIRAPLFTYEYIYPNRSGDVLIEGLLLVPYFKILGRSIFSTKVLALTSALITFLCWLLFIKKYHGMVAAILFGLLYAIPPPIFARLNLFGTISSHHLLNPLIALQSLLLFRILACRREHTVPRWVWVVSGVLAGLGVYTFYTYIIFLGFCFLFFLLCNRSQIRPISVLLFAAGAIVGFLPWMMRSLSSPAGEQFLGSMLKSIPIDRWSFIQNFCFAVPHSMGYNYPSRAIGPISVLFSLFILFCAGFIVITSMRDILQKKITSQDALPAYRIGLFYALFPVFFLVFLSLSPRLIMPFEYWPSFGLFATFGIYDPIRYRWLHILFPFYFAIIAIGMTLFVNTYRNRLAQVLIISACMFFIACGLYKSIALYSGKDFGKIFYYRGYNYDLFAPKFILGDFAPRAIKDIQLITATYPLEHRGEAYKYYGRLIAEKVIAEKDTAFKLENVLKEIPERYVKDFICGIVCAAQAKPERQFQPLKVSLTQTYPAFYYENWGYRYLGYKYYGVLVNVEVLLEHIPAVEQWFYGNFLNKFKQEFTVSSAVSGKRALLDEINAIPRQYQTEVVKGLGMLVGAEMLFDTLHAPNYPLDSRFGEQFSGPLREAFYEGVGSGFAETLCRFWRTQLLPENADSPLYEKLLDMEWNRCHALLSQLSGLCYAAIQKGFSKDLEERPVSPGIKRYIHNKLILEKG
jgi:hypothetical protein